MLCQTDSTKFNLDLPLRHSYESMGTLPYQTCCVLKIKIRETLGKKSEIPDFVLKKEGNFRKKKLVSAQKTYFLHTKISLTKKQVNNMSALPEPNS